MESQFPYQNPEPVPPPLADIPAVEPEALKPPFWKTKGLLLAVVVVATLVVGGGVGAWVYIRSSSLPVEVVMSRMMREMQGVLSFTTSYALKMNVSGEEQVGIENIEARGQVSMDFRSPNGIVQTSAHDVSVALSASSSAGTLGISSVAVSFEERSVDSTASYFRFTHLPVLGIISLSPFENKWMKVDQAVAGSVSAAGVDPIKIGKWFSGVLSDASLSSSIEDQGQESVQGREAYHYRLKFNPERVHFHIQELARVVGRSFTLDEATQLKKSLAEMIPSVPLDVWIGKKDFRIYRVVVPIGGAGSGAISISGSFDLTMSGYNTPVNVEVPSDARPIQDVVGEVFQTFGGATAPGNIDISKFRNGGSSGPDTDFDGVPDTLERSSGTNPSIADTDSDGIIDGDEINKYRTDALKSDTDGDGVGDGEEVLRWHSDPLKTDTDGDKYTDGQEIRNGYDPIGPGKLPK